MKPHQRLHSVMTKSRASRSFQRCPALTLFSSIVVVVTGFSAGPTAFSSSPVRAAPAAAVFSAKPRICARHYYAPRCFVPARAYTHTVVAWYTYVYSRRHFPCRVVYCWGGRCTRMPRCELLLMYGPRDLRPGLIYVVAIEPMTFARCTRGTRGGQDVFR